MVLETLTRIELISLDSDHADKTETRWVLESVCWTKAEFGSRSLQSEGRLAQIWIIWIIQVNWV